MVGGEGDSDEGGRFGCSVSGIGHPKTHALLLGKVPVYNTCKSIY